MKHAAKNAIISTDRLFAACIYALFFAMVLMLAFLAAIGTCSLAIPFEPSFGRGTYGEYTCFLADNPMVNIALFAVFTGMLFVLSRTRCMQSLIERVNTDERLFRRSRLAVLILLLVTCLAWVLLTQLGPRADQLAVEKIARSMITGKWERYIAPGGYLDRYPFQFNTALVFMPLVAVFKSKFFLVFQCANALFLTISYRQLADIGGLFGLSRSAQIVIILLGFLFYPSIMYCSFVYGTLGGLAFSLLAIHCELLLFERSQSTDSLLSWPMIRLIIGTTLFITIAILFKSNYLIFLIGMAVYALLRLLGGQRLIAVLLFLCLGVSYCLQSTIPDSVFRSFTGKELSSGVSAWSYIAMGLQEGETRAPGWYNCYNVESYEEAGYSTHEQAKIAQQSIAESFERMSEPSYALRFFAQKVDSMWNNPTFQGYWIAQYASVHRDYEPEAVKRFYNPQGEAAALGYLNSLQFLVLAGVLVWLARSRWSGRWFSHYSIFAIIFIGGFLCHLAWEAKCQYVIVYYLLLFPYAVAGYASLWNSFSGKHKQENAPSIISCDRRTLHDWLVPAIMFSVVVIPLAVIYASGGFACLSETTEAFYSYIDSL